jgi:hypothetical protein
MAMAGLAHVLVGQANAAKAPEAEALLRRCLAIRIKLLPTGDWRIASTRSALGGVLFFEARDLLSHDRDAAMRKLQEAGPLLSDGYHQMNPPAFAAARKTDAVSRLAEYFDLLATLEPGQGHEAEAAAWRAKLPTSSTTAPSTTPTTAP